MSRLTIAQGVGRVLTELRRLGIAEADALISTNIPVRLDGLPKGDAKEPHDPGAAVYWRTLHDEARKVMAIDLYDRVADNLAAIAATLEAMRAIERHGGAQILERAFTGFTALPAPRTWRDVLGLQWEQTTLEEARAAYRRLSHERHPDTGGSHDAMAELNQAWMAAERELIPTVAA
jgi:hypothetical protein